MATTTLPRQATTRWVALIIGAALIAVLTFAATTTLLDAPEAARVTTTVSTVSDAQRERAAHLHDAARELAALRRTVRDVPSIADSMNDRIQLLKLAIGGHIPIESLGSSQ